MRLLRCGIVIRLFENKEEGLQKSLKGHRRRRFSCAILNTPYAIRIVSKKQYEIIEHTADIGIRVKGKNLKGLFRNAALAMFDIIAEEKEKTVRKKEKLEIKQKADNVEELFMAWLNELLFLSFTKKLIFSDFIINKLEENSLVAYALGQSVKYYKMNTEIKAATYYELRIKRVTDGWKAKVIFDV